LPPPLVSSSSSSHRISIDRSIRLAGALAGDPDNRRISHASIGGI
jgi:hypothetical protein